MRHIFYTLLFFTLALTACVKSPEEPPRVREGEPARLSFTLTKPGMTPVSRGLLESEEQTIHNLYIYVFYTTGDLVSITKISDVNLSKIEADAYSGNNMRVVVIANYPENECEAMDEVTKFSDLMELQMSTDRRDVDVVLSPSILPMIGYIENITINEGNNSIPVQLEYAVAKITVRIQDLTSNDAVTSVGWDICNAATHSYMMEHGKAGGTGAATPIDAVDPENDDDFVSTNMKFLWERNGTHGTDISSIASSSIYIFENRRGRRKTGVAKLPGMTDEQYNGFRGKTLCAPERASYMQARFEYANAGDGLTYNTTMNIFFGKDNYGDYNVERGYEYIYTIKIHDGYDISVDLQVNSNLTAEVIPLLISRSSSMIMDAHADIRIIDLKASSNAVENVSIEIYDEAGNSCDHPGFSADWVKLSRLNITRFQVSQSTAEGQVWQQPYGGQEGYFARAKYIPHRSYRQKMSERGTAYQPPTGIILGSEDYPDNDDVLPYEKTSRRMCYKITDIPFEATATNHEFVIYTDEYDYDPGAAEIRYAYIVIKYTDLTDLDETGCPKNKHFESRFVQRQPLYVGLTADVYRGGSATIGQITNTAELQALCTYRPMVIERIEETSFRLNPIARSDLQTTETMQWGFSGTQLYNGSDNFLQYSNGYYLTANAVYKNVSIDSEGNVSWDGIGTNERAKWGSRAWASKNNAIPEGSGNIYNTGGSQGNSGAPFYYPNAMTQAPSANEMYHPVYNVSAARYCHEKNRDMDGDGVISPEETFWYLPSQHELQAIWLSYESIQSSSTEYGTGFYWSSSESSAQNSWGFGFATGYAASGGYAKGAIETLKHNGAVRCVRKYGDSDFNRITIEDGKPYINLAWMPKHSITTEPKGTGTGQVGDSENSSTIIISENGATLFRKFRVAVSDVSGRKSWADAVGYSNPYTGPYPADHKLGIPKGNHTQVNPNSTLMRNAPANSETGCNAYYENADQSDKGTWRLPNKRELMMMWIMKNQLENISGFTPFSSGDYWSASERRNTMGQDVSFTTGYTVNPAKTTTQYVRCIKEDLSVTTFTLIFHGNGGTGCPSNVAVYAQTTVTLPAKTPKHPDGYAFTGWSTQQNGSGTIYRAGGSFPMPANDIILYAQWSK